MKEERMGDRYPQLRVAAVQAAPVFLNREATVEKACRFIREAGEHGAHVIGFPEGFIPAHPVWFHFHPVLSPKSLEWGTELFKNAVEIPSPATEALCQAAREAGAYVVMGVCERRPHTTGTLYNTQLFIDNRGRILGKHQKVQPTIGERLVHTGGFGDTMRAFATEFGPISGLICGENQNPLAVFTLAADSTVLHVACWPHFFQKGWHTMPQVADLAGRALSYMAKCFVINACGTIDAEMRAVLPATDEDRAFLADPANLGGSSIISANSRVLAGPMGPEEGILYADIDLEVAVRSKLTHDFAGHYNRPDVFQLVLNTDAPQLLRRTTQSGQASSDGASLHDLPRNGSKGQTSVAEAEHHSEQGSGTMAP
jgi:aliphatic nitrilase